MAGSVFDLFARLLLDTSEYEKGLDGAKGYATGAGSKIGGAIKSGLKVAGAALAAGTTAVTAFAGSSVKAGMDFDTAMSQVAATMGMTVDELGQGVGTAETSFGHFEGNLRDFAQFLGANTAFSATQAAEALNYMALAGYDAQESMDMLPSVLSLAAAGSFDLARASDMITDSQTAFGISAERTTQMVDEMAKAASTGNTSVEQLGDAFLVVGGLAKELNGGMVTLADGTQAPVDGLQELEIALTAMANAGVKGSEAGTHMRNMLLKLSSPSKEGQEAFEKLGVSVFDAGGKMKSLQQIFQELGGAMNNLTQQEKLDAISAIFNVRDVASAEALLNAVGQDWDSIGAAILDAQGAAAQMAATQLDNLAGDITLFKSALEGAKIAISDGLTPTLRDFVQFSTSAVSELGTAFKERGLQGALESLGPVIDRGIELIFNALPRVLEAAVALLDAFVTAIITNLPKLIPAAVQLIQTLVQNIQQNLPQLLDAALQIIGALADGLIQVLPNLIPAIVQIIITIAEKLTEPNTLTQLVLAATQIIIALANGLIQAIPQLLEAVPQIISNLVGAIVANLPVILSAGVQILVSLVTGILGALPQLIALAPELLVAFAGGIVQGIKTIIDVGGQIVDGFLKGISDAWGGMVENVKGFVTGFIDTIKGLFGVHSPSTVFANIGMNLIAGLSKGFSDDVSGFVKSLSAFAKNIVEAISGAWKNAKSIGSNLIASIGSGISEKVSALSDVVKKIASSIGDALKRFADSAKTLGGNISLNIRNGFAEKIRDMYSVVRNMFTEIQNAFRQMIDAARNWGSGLMASFVNGIVQRWNDLVSRLNQMAQAVKDRLHFTQPDKGPLSGPHGFESYAPDMMKTFAKGIKDNTSLVTDQIEKSFDFGDSMTGFDSGTVVSRGNARTVSNMPRNTTVIMQIGRTEFGRLVYEAYNEEAQRVGVKLATGGLV